MAKKNNEKVEPEVTDEVETVVEVKPVLTQAQIRKNVSRSRVQPRLKLNEINVNGKIYVLKSSLKSNNVVVIDNPAE